MFFKIKIIRANVFAWLQEIQANIMLHDEKHHAQRYAEVQGLVLKNIGSFIEMDTASTVHLCDQWFKGDYFEIVDAISKFTRSGGDALSFSFINKVLEMRQATIMEEYMQTVIAGANNVGPSDKYKKLIIRLVQILCTRKYKRKAIEYVSRDYFPIDECLAICEKEGVTDACAILYKRKGEYKTSISLYAEVLTNLSAEVIIAVSVPENIKPFNHPDTKNAEIKRFDELLGMIIDVCE
jgi:hypothetical protein